VTYHVIIPVALWSWGRLNL